MWVRTARGDGDAGGLSAEDPAAKCLDDSEFTAETILNDVGGGDEVQVSSLPLFREHAKATYFCTTEGIVGKESIQEQKRQTVNDGELHEETPHLEEYFVPHHRVQTDRQEESTINEEETSTDAANNESATSERAILLMDAMSSELQQQARPKRKVQFSTIQIRDYRMTLGDNPSCWHGPPVTLDWDYHEYEALDVNEYESHRPPRRNQQELGLDYQHRKVLLSNAGFTEVDFARSKREVGRAKRGRTVSQRLAACYPLLKIEEAVESGRWKFKRLVKNGLSVSSARNHSASAR